MLYINGYKISKEDLEKFNKELEEGTEIVEKIIISDNGNILVYTKGYIEIEK